MIEFHEKLMDLFCFAFVLRDHLFELVILVGIYVLGKNMKISLEDKLGVVSMHRR
ncbi:hypothetical protein D3C73_1628320 [compost metagenome]